MLKRSQINSSFLGEKLVNCKTLIGRSSVGGISTTCRSLKHWSCIRAMSWRADTECADVRILET